MAGWDSTTHPHARLVPSATDHKEAFVSFNILCNQKQFVLKYKLTFKRITTVCIIRLRSGYVRCFGSAANYLYLYPDVKAFRGGIRPQGENETLVRKVWNCSVCDRPNFDWTLIHLYFFLCNKNRLLSNINKCYYLLYFWDRLGILNLLSINQPVLDSSLLHPAVAPTDAFINFNLLFIQNKNFLKYKLIL